MNKSVHSSDEINYKSFCIYCFVFNGSYWILLIFILFKLNLFILKLKFSNHSHDTTSCSTKSLLCEKMNPATNCCQSYVNILFFYYFLLTNTYNGKTKKIY